jgi:hypothetical protein
VVQRLGVGPARGTARHVGIGRDAPRALRIAPDPEGLEPADVAQLPQRRVQLGALRHLQARQCRLERGEGGQRIGAAGLQRGRQGVGRAAARLPGGG